MYDRWMSLDMHRLRTKQMNHALGTVSYPEMRSRRRCPRPEIVMFSPADSTTLLRLTVCTTFAVCAIPVFKPFLQRKSYFRHGTPSPSTLNCMPPFILKNSKARLLSSPKPSRRPSLGGMLLVSQRLYVIMISYPNFHLPQHQGLRENSRLWPAHSPPTPD
jgi:hypothetical protein